MQVASGDHRVSRKLLALPPMASGAAGVVLVRESFTDTRDPAGGAPWAVRLGLFGALVTIGLVLYELRQIQNASGCASRAAGWRTSWRYLRSAAIFRDGVGGNLGGFVCVEMASWLVYGAVFAAWLFLTDVGLGWWGSSDGYDWAWLLLVANIAVVSAKVVYIVNDEPEQE
jgi:hypothetical protein